MGRKPPLEWREICAPLRYEKNHWELTRRRARVRPFLVVIYSRRNWGGGASNGTIQLISVGGERFASAGFVRRPALLLFSHLRLAVRFGVWRTSNLPIAPYARTVKYL